MILAFLDRFPQSDTPPMITSRGLLAVLIATFSLPWGSLKAQNEGAFLKWVQAEAARLRASDPFFDASKSLGERQSSRRAELARAWGGMMPLTGPLDPKIVGVIERKEYRIEKVLFFTFPGVRVPGLLYLPKKEGKHPGVLHVHGHWKGAKQDPVVQARCVAQVRAGFVVLCVDAFGAGERAIGTALGEYHGEMTGATLLPTGQPLSAIQVLENMRAVDYLQSRPEVDGAKLGITGASGGGNQTMYAGSWDTRFGAAVPVCSVGNYQSYLGAACCMCEVVPGALQFTEEGAILGLTAPRPLMVISAAHDARQFSPGEAAKSIALARLLYKSQDKDHFLIHKIFESGHDYSKPMRETMIGFMRLHLMGVGQGEAFVEAPFTPEDPETLRLFPGNSRPKDWITLPQFAAKRSGEILTKQKFPSDAGGWAKWRKEKQAALATLLHGANGPLASQGLRTVSSTPDTKELVFTPEPGIELKVHLRQGKPGKPRLLVLQEKENRPNAQETSDSLIKAIKDAELTVVTMELRAADNLAVKNDRIGAAPDHNSAEWSLWLGRPLVGQWSLDAQRLLKELDSQEKDKAEMGRKTYVLGIGAMGLAAVAAAAEEERIDGVMVCDSLHSWVSDRPYKNQRLGNIVPGILPAIGNVPALMAMVAPRKLVVVRPVDGQGQRLDAARVAASFQAMRSAWPESGKLLTETDDPVKGLALLCENQK